MKKKTPHSTIVKMFEEQVTKTPKNWAITCKHHKITYDSLNKKANQLARYIRTQYKKLFKKELSKDTFIGIYSNRNIDMYISILAIIKAGAAYVPLDPNYPKERTLYTMENSKLSFLITEQSFAKEIKKLTKNNKGKTGCIYIDQQLTEIEKESDANLHLAVNANDLAYVIYTSGSTGKPKGVLIEHKSLTNLINDTSYIIYKTGINVLQLYSICFDVSVWVWASTLTRGANMILLSHDELPPHKEIYDILHEKKINIAPMPPAIIETMQHKQLPQLRTIIASGEKCPQNIVNFWGKNRKFINGYGPTETTIFSTISFCKPYKKVTIGMEVANTLLYILDAQMKAVKTGEIGELYIGGLGVARGYLNRPDLTKERFIEYKGNIVYKTGDLVKKLKNGELDYIGRNDYQVKIRGYRIELGEIEDALQKHQKILQTVVSVWQNKNNEPFLTAYYVSKNQKPIAQNILHKHLSSLLPKYMLPSFYVSLDHFPLSPSGKLDRNNLPDPSTQNTAAISKDVKRNPLKNEIAAIWGNILQIDSASIKSNSNFFELGGHSLLVAKMMLAIKNESNIDIALQSFLINPTIDTIVNNHCKKNDLPLPLKLQNKIEAYIHKADIIKPAFNIYSKQSGIPARRAQGKHEEHTFCVCNECEPKRNNAGNPSAKSINKNLYNPKAILITGATGFLGIYLIDELLKHTKADIYCLIRGKNLEHAQEKLLKNIKNNKLTHLQNNSRISVILGDLEKKQLGIKTKEFMILADKIDSIYHCGAYVHHLYDYNKLFKANVQSTMELLKLATLKKNKAFHFISTINSVSNYDKNGYALEKWPAPHLPKLHSGYALTKWASERILLKAKEKGLPITIYRPGNISGSASKGICNPEQNHLLLLLKSCIQLKMAPSWNSQFEALPVDVLATAIAKLSLSSKTNKKVFNLQNQNSPTWKQLIKTMQHYGFNLNIVPEKTWKNALSGINENNALFPIVSYYIGDSCYNEMDELAKTQCSKTQKTLQELNIKYPHINKKYLFTCFDYLTATGFITTS